MGGNGSTLWRRLIVLRLASVSVVSAAGRLQSRSSPGCGNQRASLSLRYSSTAFSGDILLASTLKLTFGSPPPGVIGTASSDHILNHLPSSSSPRSLLTVRNDLR